MTKKNTVCPDCHGDDTGAIDRRSFLHDVGATAAALATSGLPLWAVPKADAAPTANSAAETVVKTLYESLTVDQKKEVCFDWDHKDKVRGLLRTHVSNFWAITKPFVASNFYTKDQQMLILEVFKGIFNPGWHEKIIRQLKDDHGGKPWGSGLSMAIFGQPGTGKFEFVLTGRHLTCRADGDSESHVALGGPIFHGHAPSGFNEKVHHPGNIFWHQALEANKVYQILDGKQQEKALVDRRPTETAVGFRGADGKYPGIPVKDLSRDQKDAVQKVLLSLLDPYRKEDQDKVQECLKKQGGIDKCSLAFYKEGDIGDDGEWDNWRLEGPAFVWYFRGQPHVHIWINVAADPSVPLNSKAF
jgi:hypothetical protein